MALPTQLGFSLDDDDDDFSEVKDVNSDSEDQEALSFHETPEGTELDELDELRSVQEVSNQVQDGKIRPSWMDAVVANPNDEVVEEVEEIAYKSIGSLTAEQVINTPYSEFKHLEEPVSEIIKFVQKQLHDNDKLNDITEARVKRGKHHETMVRYLDQMVLSHMTRNPISRPEDTKTIVAMVINEILGLGPIEPLWNDPSISEIMINGPHNIKIERKGKMVKAKGVQFHSPEHLLEVCQQILGEIGRRIDVQHPMEDGRLRDGSRINVTHPVIGPGGPYVTIRRFPDTVFSMEKMVELKSMTEDMAVVLGNLVHAGCSAVIVGGTGTGKALALSTSIPTPNGMTTMGALKVGDKVLDENGQPTTVVGYFPQPLNQCYEITFSDGTKVIADEDHNWFTSTRQVRRAWSRQETDPKMINAKRKPFATLEEINTLALLAVEAGKYSNPGVLVKSLPRLRTLIYNASSTLTKADNSTPNYALYDSVELFTEITRRALNTKDQRSKSAVESIVTTKEIFATLRTSSGHANHAVKIVSSPVAYSEAKLPITPYAFGAWLGDGTYRNGGICGVDEEIFENIKREGNVEVSSKESWGRFSTQPLKTVVYKSMYTSLRALGQIKTHGGTKFIPDAYLYSSLEQRRALIAGMLDTDGSVDGKNGAVLFHNSNKAVIDGFRQVIHSLGYQSTISSKIPSYNYEGKKKKGKTAYTVSFFTNDDVFSISRKSERHQSISNAQNGHRDELRYIVDCQPVDSVPTACITVDSPNHLYLCTDAFITTHNTSMLNALSGCISNDERIITIEDNLELRIHPDKEPIALEARPAASSGSGQVTIRDLMKNTLRMRPDRIIVGEIRDESAYDMLQAMNTGHDGSLTTVHAEDAVGAVERLRNLVDESGSFNASTALTLIAGGVDLFIIIERYEDGSRRVGGIYEVPRNVKHLDNGDISLIPIPLWEFVHDSTDEEENVIGHYEQRNEVSEALIQRKRLHKRKQLSLEEIYELSKVEEASVLQKDKPEE